MAIIKKGMRFDIIELLKCQWWLQGRDILVHTRLFVATHASLTQTNTLSFRVFVRLLGGPNVSVCVGQQGLCLHSQRVSDPLSRGWTLGETSRGGEGGTARVPRGPLIVKPMPRPSMPSRSVSCGSGLDTLQ